MKEWFSIFILVAGVSMVSGPLLAHHGTRISYDRENPIRVEGTITEFMLRNPHGSVFVDVKGGDGSVVNWALEGGTIRSFIEGGFTRTVLPVGQAVTVVLYPSRVGAPVGEIASITLPDGRRFLRGPEDPQPEP